MQASVATAIGARPLVSIVVPSFNQAPYLAQTLDSILDQTYRPIEIIVADGASTDSSVEILKTYAEKHTELRWISEKDEGPADAVNKGLAMARGDIMGIFSSDDLYKPDAFSTVVATFDKHPECGLVYGDIEGIDADGRPLFIRRFPDFSLEAMFAICWTIGQGSVFFRRTLYERLGGWNATYYSCDLEYWMRLSFHTQPRYIPARLSSWRVYPGQRTSRAHFRKLWDGYWRMIADSQDIRSATPRIRRLARGSAHLLALRYHPSGRRRDVLRHGWTGFLLHPGFWQYNPWRRTAQLLPGWVLLQRAYHALRSLRMARRK